MNDLPAMKKCTKCGVWKEKSAFSKCSKQKDGLDYHCRACKKKYYSEYYARNRGKIINRSSDYYENNKESVLRRLSKYYKQPHIKAKERIRSKKRREDEPEKVSARNALNMAVQTGKIVRPGKCSRCPCEENIQGHHEDYSKPLDVDWLCIRCHRKADKLKASKGESNEQERIVNQDSPSPTEGAEGYRSSTEVYS